ncbi:hypothetical protein PG991_011672 [Apiospora marii]|uniref:Cyanovirin-N domain-containing protein n=1 Tax=Apiospora marii TaxID=335849 RepID=A0ABR1RGY0_9PEZI
MFTKTTFTALSCLAAVAVGGVLVRPDDPHASLAAEATSYEDFANRIIAAAPEGVMPPVPSPVASPAEQADFVASLNLTSTPGPSRLMSRQNQRIYCNTNAYCYAQDAGYCVSYLAGLGEQECRVGVGAVRMCLHERAGIWGLGGRGEAANSCANVARAAGRILDVCTQSDNQVTGQTHLDSDGNFNVIISA